MHKIEYIFLYVAVWVSNLKIMNFTCAAVALTKFASIIYKQLYSIIAKKNARLTLFPVGVHKMKTESIKSRDFTHLNISLSCSKIYKPIFMYVCMFMHLDS